MMNTSRSVVLTALDLADGACEGLTDSQRERVAKAFVVSSRYEWMFWDAAWRLERWPVGWGRSADPNP